MSLFSVATLRHCSLYAQAAERRATIAMQSKRTSDVLLDATAVRHGDIKTDEAKTAAQPSSHRERGRGKTCDITSDAKLRFCFEDNDVLSGHISSCARRYKCSAQAIIRGRNQCSETVLTQRDTTTHSLLRRGADIIVATLVAQRPQRFHQHMCICTVKHSEMFSMP